MPRRFQSDLQSNPGSPSPGEPVFLAVGRLVRSHGVRGDLVLEVLTDFPERLEPGTQVYIGPERQPMRLARSRKHSQGLLVAFDGITNPEQATQLRNQLVLVRADDRPPLEEGEYYHHQLLGLEVVTESGASLGRLSEILETGANDVFVVRSPQSRDLLLPATEEVVLSVDLPAGQIRVRPLPGLLPAEE